MARDPDRPRPDGHAGQNGHGRDDHGHDGGYTEDDGRRRPLEAPGDRSAGRRLPVLGLAGTWPVLRQLRDPLGQGAAAKSAPTERLTSRTETADHVAKSVCPYCAVGCGQLVYTKDGQVTQIEGDPASPISRGRLCPKGSASRGLVMSPLRSYTVKHRRPHATEWEDMPLDAAMDRIADLVVETRRQNWQDTIDTPKGPVRANRTLAIGSLGGATLDNEENYLIKKLFTAVGLVSVENQARI